MDMYNVLRMPILTANTARGRLCNKMSSMLSFLMESLVRFELE